MAVIKVDNDNFAQEVENSDVPVIIDFFADWCGPCKMMGPIFEDISSDFSGKMKFAKINVDENQQLAARFQIQSIPALVVTEKGQETSRIIGFHGKDELKDKVDEILQ